MKTTQSRGVICIDRYYVKDGALYIELNEATWDGLDKDHQHRLCELLANTDFLSKMGVPVAYLTLDSGMTTVGDISYGWFGPHCIFNPNEDYWKYK